MTLASSSSKQEVYQFAVSPADVSDEALAEALLTFASLFARKGEVGIDCLLHPPLKEPSTEIELKKMEELFRVSAASFCECFLSGICALFWAQSNKLSYCKRY